MSTTLPTTAPEVTFRLDGRTLRAPEGTFVLDVARKAGIDIPTLCNHPDLEPVGACRVCMVEVTHPDWKGWSGLMTACLYPVKEGIEVSTRSDRVKAARRGVLSLLVARCPSSKVIRDLAEQYGARADGLTSDPNADSCILCGLCTRVCETYATGAITTAGRGAVKRVATFADRPPNDCVGCGACVSVCPTSEVKAERTETDYRIWDRSFPTAVCVVDESRCVGCGSCEEACPFSVARVAFRAAGQSVAVIPAEFCRGCGACVGACPSGAIQQESVARPYRARPSADTSPVKPMEVIACGRSNLARMDDDSVRVTELPCAGRVTVPLLLSSIASGAQGVLVLGRHQKTCRFDGAEDPVRDRVEVARRLIALAGLEPNRIQFDEPAPGPEGPSDAVKTFQSSLAALPRTPLNGVVELEHEGVDTLLALMQQITANEALHADGAPFLRRHDLPAPRPNQPVLTAGSVPLLHTLGAPLFAPVDLADALVGSIAVLSHLGVQGVGIEIGRPTVGVTRYSLDATDTHGSVVMDTLLRERGALLPRPPTKCKVAVDGTAAQRSLIDALGYEAVDVGPDPLPSRFAFSADERELAARRLLAAERAGASVMLVNDPMALARWATLTRRGAWRTSRVLPILGVRLAYLALLGVAPTVRPLESTPRAAAVASEVVS